jgi:hypothetical protein
MEVLPKGLARQGGGAFERGRTLAKVCALRTGSGRDAIWAIAFGVAASQHATNDSESNAGDEVKQGVGEVAGEIGEQKDANSRVEQDSEDVANSTSRHCVPPHQEDSEARSLAEPQSTP